MKTIKLKIILVSLLICFSSCSNSDDFFSDSSKFDEEKKVEDFFSDPSKVIKGQNIVVTGIFDAKSICLNTKEENIVTDKFCLGYFSETSKPNARAVPVEITICTNQSDTNCIERLAKNTPPEDVIIRNQSGKRIAEWSKNRVILRAKEGNPKPLFEVIQID